MHRRPIRKFRPGLERFEEKQLLSAGGPAAHAHAAAVAGGSRAPGPHSAAGDRRLRPGTGYLAFRVTQHTYLPLTPPFQHVLVQHAQPVPGQTYNVLALLLKNGTAQTFDASSGFTVRLPGFTGTRRVPDNAFPILTGNQQWAPGQVIVFYALSKKYYPLSPQVAGGFQVNLGGRSSTLVPGPSAIFLRLKYNPATFDRTLDWIVTQGQGAQLGLGTKYGMPDTIVNEFVSAKTHRIDYGGNF